MNPEPPSIPSTPQQKLTFLAIAGCWLGAMIGVAWFSNWLKKDKSGNDHPKPSR
jgi:hypothetical protein